MQPREKYFCPDMPILWSFVKSKFMLNLIFASFLCQHQIWTNYHVVFCIFKPLWRTLHYIKLKCDHELYIGTRNDVRTFVIMGCNLHPLDRYVKKYADPKSYGVDHSVALVYMFLPFRDGGVVIQYRISIINQNHVLFDYCKDAKRSYSSRAFVAIPCFVDSPNTMLLQL